MLGRKNILTNILRCLVLIAVALLSAEVAGAQVPIETVDKLKAEAKPIEPQSDAIAKGTAPNSSEINTTKTATDSTKSEGADNHAAGDAAGEPANAPPVLAAPPPSPCKRRMKADVVALAQPLMMNRLGATIPGGLVFALKQDTVAGSNPVQLKDSKRPRPLVLRANVGDCLTITFTNFIPKSSFGTESSNGTVDNGTSSVSLHVQGMEWVNGPKDDGSFVGKNDSSLAGVFNNPSQVQTYTLYAKQEGTFLLYTMGDTTSTGRQLVHGLFGALNVQPAGAEWYRSQVSADDLLHATYKANSLPPNAKLSAGCTPKTVCTLTITGKPPVKVKQTPGGYLYTLDNHPLINYDATNSDGTPILKMIKMIDGVGNIVHSDITAVITGPHAGRFAGTTGPNNPEPPCTTPGADPLFCENPASPDRKQPYREITVIYHGGLGAVSTQAFPVLGNESSAIDTTQAGQDAFAINYGTGGIGAEIYANRIGVGPMGDCVDCKYEEFFLSAWSVGDPAMMVDIPANAVAPPPPPPSPAKPPIPPPPPLCTEAQLASTTSNDCINARQPATGVPYTLAPKAKATRAYYPDDPSNVYHSYINDHVKFRILHGGWDVSHVHHQHAHQWLQSPNSDQGSYLDSQMISPGASYTLEMVYNGSGNRNKVVGDSIFHCHFYPHFAAGMWAMWRTHDVFESGTLVYPQGTKLPNNTDVSGQVVPGARALPDGEILAGTPTPAIVPMPTLPMAPLPAYAQIQNNVQVNGVQIPFGGQVVIGGTCSGGKINGLDVVDQTGNVVGCTDGQHLNGTVLNSQLTGLQMTGQFQLSQGNRLENPGFPYFIPGVAGARAPHPPLDFAPDGAGGFMDGGLPRHIVTGGSISKECHTAGTATPGCPHYDWSKDLATAKATQLPEDGTDVEKAAMTFFGKRCYATFFPDGNPGSCPSSLSTPPQSTLKHPPTGFILNGLPRKTAQNPNGAQHGAPFADPAVDDNGNAIGGSPRIYKAAAIQMDVVFNKVGWHYPQQRMLGLWKDIVPTVKKTRPAEPLFFRGNSGDIIEYWHTNLVPNYYEQDAFQVQTPTDILGQHIHLVKFDVTSSDGAGNGFNYEDGTFSPEEVQELIHAINQPGGSWTHCTGCSTNLRAPQPPPADICAGNPLPECTKQWMGAQTTIQRWYLDPLVDDAGVDRTLRTVFTHDHFGPSTHQQAGLYAGLLVEPMGSTWTSNDGAETFGTRSDGGPTSWQARILTGPSNADSYREFMLEFQDLQLAYCRTGDCQNLNTLSYAPTQGDTPINAPSAPSLVTTGNTLIAAGTMSINYKNDPIAYRVGREQDLSYAFDNATVKKFDVNCIQDPNSPKCHPDPLTPLLRAYQNDKVQVRVLVGAHAFAHQFNLEGPTWFSEPSWKNSGYRSAQAMGLSEHFELLFQVPASSAPNTSRKCPDKMSQADCVDYLYSPSFDVSGIQQGLWGIFRSYDPTQKATNLEPLPNNPIGPTTNVSYATCPASAHKRVFNVTAVTAQKALAGYPLNNGKLTFNTRGDALVNSFGVMYVRTEDLDAQGKLKTTVPVEPLILRANAGDCIEVNLTNALDPASLVFTSPSANFLMAPPFNILSPVPPNTPIYQSRMSKYVGLHPQLLSYDGATSSGINVGWNSEGGKNQVVPFGQTIKYEWYAGKIDRAANGTLTYTPVEFGALNLFPSDPLFQHLNGLIGQMIIEPPGATWKCGDAGSLADCDGQLSKTRAAATVTLAAPGGKFREFALMISDDIRIEPTVGYTAVNYRTEPWQFRYTGNATSDFSCMLSNKLINAEPQTPIFTAAVGDTVRFRLTHPYGTGNSQVFSLHGHVWQRNPYKNDSKAIGNNNLSQWLGSRDNHGSTDHFDMVINKAGGESGRAGDYLYTVFQPIQAQQGQWGIFRVGNLGGSSPIGDCPKVQPQPGAVTNQPGQPDDGVKRFMRPSTSNPSSNPKPKQ